LNRGGLCVGSVVDMNKMEQQPYKIGVSKEKLVQVIKQIGLPDCYIRGGKQEMVIRVLSHYDSGNMFSYIAKNELCQESISNKKKFMELCKIEENPDFNVCSLMKEVIKS